MLIVSHNNAQTERMCNRAIWIEKGHTRMIGDAKEVCRTYSILGGHQGSSKSEQRVFPKLLLESPKVPDPASYTAIAGDDRYGTAAKLMEGRPLGAAVHRGAGAGRFRAGGRGGYGCGQACAFQAPLLLFRPASKARHYHPRRAARACAGAHGGGRRGRHGRRAHPGVVACHVP